MNVLDVGLEERYVEKDVAAGVALEQRRSSFVKAATSGSAGLHVAAGKQPVQARDLLFYFALHATGFIGCSRF
jgi:hypothetical protein